MSAPSSKFELEALRECIGELLNEPDEASNLERDKSFGSNELDISAEASNEVKSASEKEVYERAKSKPSSLSKGDSWMHGLVSR